MRDQRCLVLFTKPARAGRVKTRLIGNLTAEQAAGIHGAFVEDIQERLMDGDFTLRIAWALERGEKLPASRAPDRVPSFRQAGEDLGERLFRGLSAAAESHPHVAALGSDHPHLSLDRVHRAFERLEAGAPLVLGPAEDGGYYLIGVRREILDRRLFAGIPWSTGEVLEESLDRARGLGLEAELLPTEWDVDRPEDLRRLAEHLAARPAECPRTSRLLASLGLPAADPSGDRPKDRSAVGVATR